MFIDIIILVLRETLEAGALLSILLCVSGQNSLKLTWLWMGLAFGTLLAGIYALNFSSVSDWFDYSGQELLNAGLQTLIFIGLLGIVVWLLSGAPRRFNNMLTLILGMVICFAITRELTEMVIFYTGFFQSNGSFLHAVTSGFIGLTIGISFGVLCFLSISTCHSNVSRILQIILLSLIAAGISVQAIQLLIQIDWISGTKPFWDSSWLLSESSILGQMTYAVFGYEATPSTIEIVVYFGTLIFVSLVTLAKFSTQNNR